jgi:hypothetical protein
VGDKRVELAWGGRERELRALLAAEKRGRDEGAGGLPNPNSSYIYDERDIGLRFGMSRLLFLVTGNIVCPLLKIDYFWRRLS